MKKKIVLKHAGVLLIALVMVLSTIAVTGTRTYKNNAPEMQTTNDNDEIIFLEDFEYPKLNESDPDLIPPPGWDVTGSWGYIEDAYSGDFAIECLTTEGTLQSPTIDLTPFNTSYEPSLRFAYSLSPGSYLQINYQLDGGAIAVLDSIDYEDEGWMEAEYDVTAWAGCEVELIFIVGSTSISGNPPPTYAEADLISVWVYPVVPCENTIYVDSTYTSGSCGGYIWGVDAFNNIKEGVLHCCPNGIVHVYPGDYVEVNIGIHKPLTIQGEDPSNAGDNDNDCIVRPPVHACGSVFIVTSPGSGTVINKLTIKDGYAGIKTDLFKGYINGPIVFIQENYITECYFGIYLYYSSSCQIWNNILISNECGYPPSINGGGGIVVCSSNSNFISDNVVIGNAWEAYFGIYMRGSYENYIWCNIFSSCWRAGIVLCRSHENVIYWNNFLNTSSFGIEMRCSAHLNEIYWNNFIQNLHPCNGAPVPPYDNIFDYNGLGNYWWDYQGKYPHATDNSGIWSDHYNIGGAMTPEKDHFPSVEIFSNFDECICRNLIISKVADRTYVTDGSIVTYTIQYENPFPTTITNAYIFDELPNDLCYMSANPIPSILFSNGIKIFAIRWGPMTIGPYGNGVISLVVKVCNDTMDTITNRVNIFSDETHTATASATVLRGIILPPPSITGVINGKVGEEYSYSLVTTDPDGKDIYYYVDWGDETYTDWFGPYSSGETAIAKHSWNEEGTFVIKAKAKNIDGVDSDWAELSVSMPRNRAIQRPFLQFLQQHPILHLLFQRFLRL